MDFKSGMATIGLVAIAFIVVGVFIKVIALVF